MSEAVSLEDIRQFRQLGSKTPGHPEYRLITGVETTTGPLGQGCGNSVGMAITERALAARFNRGGFSLLDHDVYALCGDGNMMEGVSGEAASLAGLLSLSNLYWIYDSSTDLAPSTGSEVSLAVAAHEKLAAGGVLSRVVSMPSGFLFEKQDQSYRDSVLPAGVKARLAVEQAVPFGLDRYVGPEGAPRPSRPTRANDL